MRHRSCRQRPQNPDVEIIWDELQLNFCWWAAIHDEISAIQRSKWKIISISGRREENEFHLHSIGMKTHVKIWDLYLIQRNQVSRENRRGLSTEPCGTSVENLYGADLDLLQVIMEVTPYHVAKIHEDEMRESFGYRVKRCWNFGEFKNFKTKRWYNRRSKSFTWLWSVNCERDGNGIH